MHRYGIHNGNKDTVGTGWSGKGFGCGNPLAFADVKEGEVVLDLGSGAGFDLLIASDKVGPTGKAPLLCL